MYKLSLAINLYHGSSTDNPRNFHMTWLQRPSCNTARGCRLSLLQLCKAVMCPLARLQEWIPTRRWAALPAQHHDMFIQPNTWKATLSPASWQDIGCYTDESCTHLTNIAFLIQSTLQLVRIACEVHHAIQAAPSQRQGRFWRKEYHCCTGCPAAGGGGSAASPGPGWV